MKLTQMIWEGFAKKPPHKTNKKNLSLSSFLALNPYDASQWSSRDYASLSEIGFAQNIIAYRCIRMISEAGAMVPVLCHEQGVEIKDHPLLTLLRRPNKEQSLSDFLEKLYAFLQVSGNAYVERVLDGDMPMGLYLLRPDRVSVRVDDYGWPLGYEYRLDGHDPRLLQMMDGVCPVYHHNLFHPSNDHYGLSPLAAAGKSIDIHNGAGAWNKALFDNLARPSGALTYKGPEGAPNLTDEQFSRLKAELEENYQGLKNAGRPLLLEGGLDWLPFSLSPQDMDFIQVKNLAAREIALAFGVPPQLLGIQGDNTYANYAEANRAFWRLTIIPMVTRFLASFGKWLCEGAGYDFVLLPDLNAVPALAEERSQLWQRIGKAEFLTLNEKRAALGYGRLEGGDVFSHPSKKKRDRNEG